MQILRGRGFQDCRGIDQANGVFRRPLLDVSRSDLRQYLTINSLPWREDPSNATAGYVRNSIRLQQLPAIQKREDINRWLAVRGEAARRHWQCAESWVQKLCRSEPENICALDVVDLPEPMLCAVVSRWAVYRKVHLGRSHLLQLARGNCRVALGQGWLERIGTKIWLLTAGDLKKITTPHDAVFSPDQQFSACLLDKSEKVINVSVERGYPAAGKFPGSGPHEAKKLFRRMGIPALIRSHCLWFLAPQTNRVVVEYGGRLEGESVFLLP